MINLLFFQLGLSVDKIAFIIQHADWYYASIEAAIILTRLLIALLVLVVISYSTVWYLNRILPHGSI